MIIDGVNKIYELLKTVKDAQRIMDKQHPVVKSLLEDDIRIAKLTINNFFFGK